MWWRLPWFVQSQYYLYVQLQLKGFEPVSVVQQPEPPADTAIIRTSDYLFALPPNKCIIASEHCTWSWRLVVVRLSTGNRPRVRHGGVSSYFYASLISEKQHAPRVTKNSWLKARKDDKPTSKLKFSWQKYLKNQKNKEFNFEKKNLENLRATI